MESGKYCSPRTSVSLASSLIYAALPVDRVRGQNNAPALSYGQGGCRQPGDRVAACCVPLRHQNGYSRLTHVPGDVLDGVVLIASCRGFRDHGVTKHLGLLAVL